MKTMTFTPHDDLNTLDPDFRKRWAERLLTSRQFKGDWINPVDDSERCCLTEAFLVESGVTDDISKEIDNLTHNRKILPETTKATEIICATDQNGWDYYFACLNDYYLTHPQISKLLNGETVTIEVAA